MSQNIQLIQLVLLILLNLITFSFTIWIAFFSPQAIYAKIQKNEYINIQRQNHYKKLKENVFEPLSLITAQNTPLSNFIETSRTLNEELILNYDISKILNNPLFNLASLHLDKDFSGMSKGISLLDDNISRYNDETHIFIEGTIVKISDEIQKYGSVVDNLPLKDGQVYFPLILDLLIAEWWAMVNKHKQLNSPITTIIAGIKPFDKEKDIKHDHEGGIEILGRTVMKGISSKNIDEIISIIESYRSNQEVILRLTEIMNKQNELIKKSKEFANKCKEVSDLITKEGYETIASCCLNNNFLRGV